MSFYWLKVKKKKKNLTDKKKIATKLYHTHRLFFFNPNPVPFSLDQKNYWACQNHRPSRWN